MSESGCWCNGNEQASGDLNVEYREERECSEEMLLARLTFNVQTFMFKLAE